MRTFKSIEDVEEWLEGMDYQGFWYAIAPYNLTLQDRDQGYCDDQIARCIATEDMVLDVLKALARIELTDKLGLEYRPLTPWVQLVETH